MPDKSENRLESQTAEIPAADVVSATADAQADVDPARQDPPEGAQPAADPGLSLDQLSEAYAELLQQDNEPAIADSQSTDEQEASQNDELHSEADPGCEISPRSVLEAMLFVGCPDNSPLTSKNVASLMRGVRPQEIDQLVQELNGLYDADGSPYHVVSDDAGYRMVIRDEHAGLRDKFYGRVRQARLSQPAVDILAIVAYHQPSTRADVEQLRGAPSGSILTQLVRRQLLAVSRSADEPRTIRYVTTQRFLDLFHLESLDDLPRQETSPHVNNPVDL